MRSTSTLPLLLLALACLTGCGTLLGPGSDTPPAQASQDNGMQNDLQLSGAYGAEGEAHAGTVFCYRLIVCPLVTAASLPADAGAENPLLPSDHLRGR